MTGSKQEPIQIRQATPAISEIEALMNFADEMDEKIQAAIESGDWLSPPNWDILGEYIKEEWEKDFSLSRILFALTTLMDNVLDLSVSYLKYRPEIEQALDMRRWRSADNEEMPKPGQVVIAYVEFKQSKFDSRVYQCMAIYNQATPPEYWMGWDAEIQRPYSFHLGNTVTHWRPLGDVPGPDNIGMLKTQSFQAKEESENEANG